MKNQNEDFYFKRKEKFVEKEFDTGFSSYQRNECKVSNLRQWTVTINVGFVLYVITNNNNMLLLTIVVLVFMLILLLLELRTRSSMMFDKTNILDLERLIDEKNYDLYYKSILDYRFRDDRLRDLTAFTKLKHYLNAFKKAELIVWYGMWAIIWISIIIYLRWSWFSLHLWIPIGIASLYLVIFSYMIFKYFRKRKK